MNILIVSGRSIFGKKPCGGAETSMALLAQQFSARGHHVYYFSNKDTKWPGTTIKTVDGIEIIKFRPFFIPKSITDLFPFLRFHNRDRLLEKKLFNILISNKIEIVYAFGKIFYNVLHVKNSANLNFKTILRVAGITESATDAEKYNSVIDPVFTYLDQTDVFNFQSGYHKESFLKILSKQHREMPKKVEFIHDIGIHPGFFRNKTTTQHSDQLFRIVCVMRFSSRKRQDLLIEALSLLDDNICLEFYGDGPDKEQMQKKVKFLNLDSKIQFKGFLVREKLIESICQASLYVHPVDYEPQSKAVWEAMALRIPVLASDVPSLNNIIIDNKTGFLCKNTPEAWAESIHSLAHNKANIGNVTKEAFIYVKSVADPALNIIKFEKFFNELVSNPDIVTL